MGMTNRKNKKLKYAAAHRRRQEGTLDSLSLYIDIIYIYIEVHIYVTTYTENKTKLIRCLRHSSPLVVVVDDVASSLLTHGHDISDLS